MPPNKDSIEFTKLGTEDVWTYDPHCELPKGTTHIVVDYVGDKHASISCYSANVMSNTTYQEEFEKYEKALAKYNAKLKEYNKKVREYNKKQKIAELEKERAEYERLKVKFEGQ